MSEFQTHQQLILRVYDELAAAIQRDMESDEEIQPIEIKQQGDMQRRFLNVLITPLNLFRRYSSDFFSFFLQGKEVPCFIDQYALQYWNSQNIWSHYLLQKWRHRSGETLKHEID